MRNSPNVKDSDCFARYFTRLMFAGKTAAAIQLLTMGFKRGGVLHLGDIIPGLGKVHDILKSKQSIAAQSHSDSLISNNVARMHPFTFKALV